MLSKSDRLIPAYRPLRRALGERWKHKVRVHDQFLKTVAFLCEDDSRGVRTPAGTAFFVSVGDEGSVYDHAHDIWTFGETFTYAVTARHCIEDRRGDPPIYLRINLEGGGYKDFETHKNDWKPHPEADVAVMLLIERPEHAALDTIALPLFVQADYKCRRDYATLLKEAGIDDDKAELIGEQYKDGIDIAIGDDLFFPGLFVRSAGKQSNLPIVRFGHIARMPREDIRLYSPVRGDFYVRAYLAEVQSWFGFSGSPVFWHFDLSMPERYWVRGLMGLISAHFDLWPRKRGRVHTNEQLIKLNSGIAVVTPAENIRELLMHSEVERKREDEKKVREKSQPAATLDSASASKKTRDIEIPPIGRGDFFRNLKKATQRKKTP